MNYIGKFISNFKDFYNEINAATLTGAIDVVVVRQEDGSYHTSPFHVRFGKIGVLRSREKIVDIEINGEPVDIHMKLGESGEAFFVEELEDGSFIDDPQLGTSPLSPSDLLEHYKDIDKDKHRDDDIKSQDDSGVEAEDHTYAKPHNSSSRTEAGSLTSLSFSEKATELTVDDAAPLLSRSFTDQATELTVDTGIADLSNTFPTLVEKTDNGSLHSEIGVVYRVRKNSGKYERRNIETQTIRPVEVPRNIDNKGISRSFTEGNGRKFKGSLDGPGSKTDIEEVIKPSKNVRRKRKKRNNKAAKGRAKSSGSQSSDNSTTSEVTDPHTISSNNSANQDSIFIMEDIESDKLPGSATSTPNSQLTQSTSLPLLKERTSIGNKDGNGDWSDLMSRSMGPDFHPFSDTDISPPPSPSNSRPPTPIKSDTEYETEGTRTRCDSSSQTDVGKWSWTWGELPTPPPKSPTRKSSKQTEESGGADNSTSLAGEDHGESGLQTQSCATKAAEDEKQSMFGSMINFMRATKKVRHNPESEGIYLDDLDLEALDPEVAALYFPRSFRNKERSNELPGAKDEDVESGNGPSLPHSPHSVEGAIGGPKILSDSESEEPRHPIFDYRGYHDIAFSRCGVLPDHVDKEFPESIFMQNLVTYDDFCEDPSIFDDPDLVIRFGGKYLNWKTAAPQIMSLVLFQRPVPSKVKENLALENMPKREPIRKRTESKGLLWFSSWRRGNQDEDDQNEDNAETDKTQENSEVVCDLEVPVGDAGLIEVTSHETQTSLPGTPTKKEMHNRKVGQDSSESEEGEEGKDRHPSGERYKKSLRLTSEQIQKFGLKDGPNEVVFSVTTAYQGTSRCKCHIFLWNYDDKIVVSDIDGTITKSDVLGHILPIIGKDWAQSGVAQLFTKIKNNGYHFLYLSARAIGQAHITREYLKSIKQGDLSLPDGPLLLNPTSLVNAFHREVIEKKPEEFKISCLRDVQKLFPQETNPFYAGYGNRINDVWAYKHVGIPISRIFTINHRGELRHELTQAFQSSYCLQSKCVDDHFPPQQSRMVPRDLLMFMYSDSEDEEEFEDRIDDYDSEWEGFPTGRDAVELVFSGGI